MGITIFNEGLLDAAKQSGRQGINKRAKTTKIPKCLLLFVTNHLGYRDSSASAWRREFVSMGKTPYHTQRLPQVPLRAPILLCSHFAPTDLKRQADA
jgi:hypothetical protein